MGGSEHDDEGIDIRIREGRQPRTCAKRGGDFELEPKSTDQGMRIAFQCPEFCVHSVLDPFEGQR